MIILAIESSCDETAVALVRDGREIIRLRYAIGGGERHNDRVICESRLF